MYSIYDQINNRKVLVYPERKTVDVKTTDSVVLSNEQIASTNFPEDVDVKTEIYFDKVVIGEGNYIFHGDNIQVLKTLPDNSVDSVVTDGPYGLKFMGKNWDEDVPSVELWKEVYRIIKPGGYVLSFGSPRTYHRMATKLEDVGFEIRDQIMWVYGSGFPKSHDIGKAIDKNYGRLDYDLSMIKTKLKDLYKSSGKTMNKIDEECGFRASGYLRIEHRDDDGWGEALPTLERWIKISEVINCNIEIFNEYKSYFEKAEREIIGKGNAGFLENNQIFDLQNEGYGYYNITKSKTPEGQKWEGWGTALKPSHEPICMARKPFKGSASKNVLKWSTGGININDCRIEFEDTKNPATNPLYRQENDYKMPKKGEESKGSVSFKSSKNNISSKGRFPANIIFDDFAGEILDKQSGKCGNGWKKNYGEIYYKGKQYNSSTNQCIYGGEYTGENTYSDNGGASRFFYCPKPSKKEKEEGLKSFPVKSSGIGSTYAGKQNSSNISGYPERKTNPKKNFHPTVKPKALMQYLIRLVTPKGGVTLDPFFGSGTSGISVLKERDFKFIGIEKEKEYFDIAISRCQYEYEQSIQKAA